MPILNRSMLFALLGIGFGFGFYQFDNQVKDAAPEKSALRYAYNAFELLILCPSMGILAWMVAEKLRHKEASHQRGLEQERGRRFLLLGRLAASVAHELRNPIHNLCLISEDLRMDATPANRDILDSLDANLKRLDNAVSLVYELSRPNHQADGVEPEAVSLAPLVNEAVVEAERRTGRRLHVEVKFPEESVIVVGREASLRIVLGNLVRNAAEAAGDSSVRIQCCMGDEKCKLEVINAGSLPDDVVSGEIPHASSKPDGMGVGISIARHLTEHLGGQLTFENRDGCVVACLVLGMAGVGLPRE